MSKWPTVKLGDVLTRVERFEPRDELTEYPFAGTYSFARGIFVGERKLGSTFALPKIQRIRAGDFIYCKIMAWEGAFGIAPKETDNCVMSGAFVVYELKREKIDEKFLDYFFKVPDHWQTIGSQSSGTNVRRQSLHPSQFERAEIPLPPLAEQRRVVARIEELAAQIHEARTLRHQAAEEADVLPRKRADELLDSELVPRVPLRDLLSEPLMNGLSVPASRLGSGVSFAKVGVVNLGVFDPDETKLVDVELAPDSRYWLRKGDIVVSRGNSPEFVGRAAVYEGKPAKCAIPDLLIRVRLNSKKADTRFVSAFFHTSEARDYIAAQISGTSSTMPKISQPKLEALPVPVPPLTEQRRIVAELDALQAEVDALKRLQAETAAGLDALLPALLDRAFKGEL